MATLLDLLQARVHTTHRSIVGFLMQILAAGFNHMFAPNSTCPSVFIDTVFLKILFLPFLLTKTKKKAIRYACRQSAAL